MCVGREGARNPPVSQGGASLEKFGNHWFRIRKAVFYRLKIRSKIANIAEINVEKGRGGIKTAGITITRVVRLRNSEAERAFTI